MIDTKLKSKCEMIISILKAKQIAVDRDRQNLIWLSFWSLVTGWILEVTGEMGHLPLRV